jgi:acyl carrier protein
MDQLMNELQTRLATCFTRVFPGLPENKIRSATPQTLAEWDSVASISLVNVIEEEFNTEIDFELLAELDSFDAIANYLTKRIPITD